MNDFQRLIQIREQVLRIGKEPASKSFLDSCDPDGIPWLLRSIDAEIADQHRRWTAHWGWGKVWAAVILTISAPFLLIGLIELLRHL